MHTYIYTASLLLHGKWQKVFCYIFSSIVKQLFYIGFIWVARDILYIKSLEVCQQNEADK